MAPGFDWCVFFLLMAGQDTIEMAPGFDWHTFLRMLSLGKTHPLPRATHATRGRGTASRSRGASCPRGHAGPLAWHWGCKQGAVYHLNVCQPERWVVKEHAESAVYAGGRELGDQEVPEEAVHELVWERAKECWARQRDAVRQRNATQHGRTGSRIPSWADKYAEVASILGG
jgi:hypothetical protein